MQTLHVLMVFLGLTFTGFVMMMNKGATLENLSGQKTLVYSLIVTAVNTAAMLIGYGISMLCRGFLSSSTMIIIAYLILFFIGIYLTIRAYHIRDTEEKADRTFNNRRCFKLALRFSYGVILVGAGCFMLGIDPAMAVGVVAAMTLLSSFAALSIGYQFGPRFSRTVGTTGGILMIVFTLIRFVEYLGGRG